MTSLAPSPVTPSFPIDLGAYQPLALDPARPALTAEEKRILQANLQLCRDVIVSSPPPGPPAAWAVTPAAPTTRCPR